MLPLAMVVLLASAVPANIAGWGPREGAAAWAFGAVGLSAEGVIVAVVYGVLALVATLPGAVILVADRRGDSWHGIRGHGRDGACKLAGAQAERVGGVVHV